MNTAPNIFDQDFEQFLTNCETLMELATSKEFDSNESTVILMAAKHLDAVANEAVNMFEMDIILDKTDKVAQMRLKQARDCIIAVARIIERMQANILLADINLN